MTKKEAVQQFKRMWAQEVRANPRLRNDIPARDESWNNWTDYLCKDGVITPRQYSTWSHPFN